MKDYQYSVLDRFLHYVTIDTQSDPESTSFPSTEKQKNLGKILVEELISLGITDAHLDEYGYVYATLPGNSTKKVPTICLCSHMDTSPDADGKNVKPLVHSNYQGQDLVLPDDPNQVIRLSEHPNLGEQIGNDIVTASGTTLLGADNKAGLAEIMDAVQYFMSHPDELHGDVRILFTPDEEIGHGVDHVDIKKLGADFGYTIDGEKRGTMEDETFSADAASVIIHGVIIHPGFAKGKLENALKIGGEILAELPKGRLSPETTSGKEGFLHPTSFNGLAEKAEIKFIVRDFTEEGLKSKEAELQRIVDKVLARYPNSTATVTFTEQYRNMKVILDQYPEVVENVEEAIRRAGMVPEKRSIRGGTDGSRLSFMGLPCPNIFAGEHAFHSKHEWVTVQDMQKAVDTIIQLVKVWEERA
ncbi:MAG: peptidase T [Saprospiraceae bacterium]|nr:peptidase T [Saprospiraceae bacterium]